MSWTFDPLISPLPSGRAQSGGGGEAAPANGSEGQAGRQWVCPGAAGEGAADAAIVRSSRLGQCLAPRRQPPMFSSE